MDYFDLNPDTPPEFSRPLRNNRMNRAINHDFDEKPNADELKALSGLLDTLNLAKMRFSGILRPIGKKGWDLTGKLGVTVTQACVVTLEPVKTRIDINIRRQFLPEPEILPETEEIDPDESDQVEVLGDVIDLGLIATEALAMALPDYPRAPDANLPSEASDGLLEKDLRKNPFSALENLRDKLSEPKT